MTIITPSRLDSANYDVTAELRNLGFYSTPMQSVDTYLVPIGCAYGWQHYGGTGEINIPCVSLSRFKDYFTQSYTSLRDVIRHEFGHALADTHRGLFRSSRFVAAFGASHGWSTEWEHDQKHHVTPYAATAPAEDFAEVFMIYVRHAGRLPSNLSTAPIRLKWRFIDDLRKAVSSGKKRW